MRILSLHPAATEILFAIGAGGQLVGRTEYCTYPESALKVPSIGKEFAAENVAIFEPDLVITGRGQDDLARDLAHEHDVFHFNPRSVEALFTLISRLAERTGKHVEADMTLHDLMGALERIRKKSQKFKNVRVYFEIDHNPPTAANCYLSEIVSLAGGELYTGEVTPEKLQEFDPQFIIVSKPGEGEAFDAELLLARDGWQDLNAVKYERVYVLDDKLFYRPGPRLVDGIKRLAMILHGIDASNGDRVQLVH